MNKILLQVKDIDVYYGDTQVLSRVSIDVEEGKLVSVLGPNGAGKTTLIKTISGLLKPRSGQIIFDEVDITRYSPHMVADIGICTVPEGRRIFPNLTVRENLLMGAYNSRARKNIRESLERVYKLFPILEERERQVAKTLSGGEAQMLAIGRALMSCPRMLLLDEPSLGLAPLIVSEVFKIIEELKKSGITILLVEQHITHALGLSDYVYILENGRVVLSGRKDDIRENKHVREYYLGI
ncbi:MAG: ABC transporter ATP-binding protein [Thermoproteota archaeon]|uniref:ABC transporter ATP-binding protein n=1 Tax=Ignisphaera aggregans TaxID=334771 RepID=A0A7J3I667_9CREN